MHRPEVVLYCHSEFDRSFTFKEYPYFVRHGDSFMPFNSLDEYVCWATLQDNKSDIYICGMSDRNRALNGDVVCVLLNSREDWKVTLVHYRFTKYVLFSQS